MLSQQELKQGIKEIPPLSPVVVDILNMLNSDIDVDFSVLEKKLLQDPGLTGRVLALANSPFFGMAGEVSCVKDACLILGINAIRNLVISSAMMNQFPSNSATNLDIHGLWRHSIASAATAKTLSRHTSLDPDQAFTAALLHDIGKMVLDIHFPALYLQVINHQQDQQCLIREAEENILGCDHSEVGALVAQKWKLPDEITDTIRAHHNREQSQASTLTNLVNLSDIVSRGLALGNPGDDFIPQLDKDILQKLNIGLQDIADSMAEIEALYDSFISMLE